jgi:hypothetical protein
VSELVERDATTADHVFQAAVYESGLSAQFRDDTLVSMLRSPSSPAFLERHCSELFANDKQHLKRVIHLLRVACVTTPVWLETTTAYASLFHVPEGVAWACVLRLVQSRLNSFAEGDCSLLLGLIEDWARGVHWRTPYPDGAEPVAAIAHWLLPGFDDYRSKDQRKLTLQVIAKIPNADRDGFAAILQGKRKDEERDRVAEELREIIFEGTEGTPAARDMPKVVVTVLGEYLLCTEADLRSERGYGSHLDLEPLFGIKAGRSHDFFPASAYRGSFLPLLRYHSRDGLPFVIKVFNHSAEWYAHPRVRPEYVEPPFETVLTFADGTTKTQWCNDRLWLLYRGMSVGPYVLQSFLMAFEQWLLEYAEICPDRLDAVLLRILKDSNSVALTAVVASVATAFPRLSGESLLVLLRSPLCIMLDRQRYARESQAPSKMFGFLPRLDNRNKFYEEERKEADNLPHRSCDLERAIARLQMGPFAERVQEILDQHQAAMLAMETQNEEDRIWRLALHRMDLRQYTITVEQADCPVTEASGKPEEDKQTFVLFTPKAPDADVKEMSDKSTVEFQEMNSVLDLQLWGMAAFRREESAASKSDQWHQRLLQAQVAKVSGDNKQDLGAAGPGFVAAVCIRDRWLEMTKDEQDWCVNNACLEVEREANLWNRMARSQRSNMSSDRPCARILPLLIGMPLPEAQRARVNQMLVVALTHAIDEVRWYAAWGVGEYLWAIDRELALRCVNMLAMEAAIVQEAADAEYKRPHPEREFLQPYPRRRELDEIEAEAAATVRQRFFEPGGIAADALQAFDSTRWFGAEANGHILSILGQAPAESCAVEAYQCLGHTLVGWWDEDDDDDRDQNRRERNHDTESGLSDLLQDFLLRVSPSSAETILQPILDAVDRHPREVHWLLERLIAVEDRQKKTTQFWTIWEMFANKVRQANWLEDIDSEYSRAGEMMSAIFLGASWKEDARHWRSLEGHASKIDALFDDLPPTAKALEDYLRFLYNIGEQSLPGAFIRIVKRLQQGDPGQMLRKWHSVYKLEVLLQRHVYGRPLELKRNHDLRGAVLVLLDMLVDQGSSAAFRMRDDFVTPIPIQ